MSLSRRSDFFFSDESIFEICKYIMFFLFPRLIQDVQTYVEQLGEECAVNVALKR